MIYTLNGKPVTKEEFDAAVNNNNNEARKLLEQLIAKSESV